MMVYIPVAVTMAPDSLSRSTRGRLLRPVMSGRERYLALT
jgi:hypothetical protein